MACDTKKLYIYKYFANFKHQDSLAEWSKAPDLGSGPKGRGFKSHSCHLLFIDLFFILFFLFPSKTELIHNGVEDSLVTTQNTANKNSFKLTN